MNLETALIHCRQLEQHAPDFGLHIGLTGGCLYKDGERKDMDIILYRIRQEVRPDLEGFFLLLNDHGWSMGKQHGWVTKMRTPAGDEVDFFYPEYLDKAGLWDRLKGIFSSETEFDSGGY